MTLGSTQLKMIRKLLQSGTEDQIARLSEKIHPTDLTVLFSELSPNLTVRLINALFSIEKAGETFLELPEFMIPDILALIDDAKLATIISRQEPDDALFLLEKLPEDRWKQILDQIPVDKRKRLDKLLIYPKYSCGTMMTSNFFSINVNKTAEETINSLRAQPHAEGIFYVYVVDDANNLVGVQSLRNLVMSPPERQIKDIMTRDVYYVKASDPQEEATKIVAQYNLLAIPVVTDTHELIGIITVDDVIDIVKEEATEDIYHIAGLSEEDHALTPIKVKLKKRTPWMIINLFTAMLASTVVGFFQDAIKEMVTLAVFLPIVASMGGNGGMQTLTVTIRSMALGELSFIKGYKVVLKEMMTGVLIGIVCGVIIGVLSYFWIGNVYLGLVLFLSTILNLFVGGIFGALVPLMLNKFKLDPAIGTSVLVTTATDVFGFFFFLGLASFFLKNLVPT